ncbi:DUF3192 domain-containing protein [Rheinheimera sp.]|uniref:DUF3192 domain-containing protein n=1 Tax=Rheinheimera sp. TaxID=1869214 RepID=UPI00307E88BA
MSKKVWLLLGSGILLYLALTILVLLFYKDEPDQMDWQDREAFNTKLIYKMDMKQPISRTEVIAALGGPDITEAILVSEQIYQMMYYRTHRTKSDGITTKDECTALLFKNNQLIAIGENAIEQYNQLR